MAELHTTYEEPEDPSLAAPAVRPDGAALRRHCALRRGGKNRVQSIPPAELPRLRTVG